MELKEYLRSEFSSDVANIVSAIAESSLRIWEEIPRRKAILSTVNPYGEKQAELDVFADNIFREAILKTGDASEIASEETKTPVSSEGRIHVAMDPLDGSSNIETNNPVGSIFCLFSENLPCPARYIICSLYVTYGPMLTITLSAGKGVQRFVASRVNGEYRFILSEGSLRIKDEGEVYSFGGQRKEWIEPVLKYVETLEQKGLKLRYCGTFVGDFNQILKYGGIFGYPALKSKPGGKLRLLFEAIPVSYVAANASGYSSNGIKDILSIEPSSLEETTPIYTGSKRMVKELESMIS
jgi:fructose-1,6-bisphosphatase I